MLKYRAFLQIWVYFIKFKIIYIIFLKRNEKLESAHSILQGLKGKIVLKSLMKERFYKMIFSIWKMASMI